jgi:drug/metabolite transporter (DMT)-like permease
MRKRRSPARESSGSHRARSVDCGLCGDLADLGWTFLALALGLATIPPFLLMGGRSLAAGMQRVCGGVALVAGGAVLGEFEHFSALDVSATSWAGLLYLVGAGSLVGFTAYLWLLDNAPGPLVTTYTFVNPIIAVILGWRFLDERPTP